MIWSDPNTKPCYAPGFLQITGEDGSPPMWVDGRPARFGDVVILLRSLKFKSDDFAGILRGQGCRFITPAAPVSSPPPKSVT